MMTRWQIFCAVALRKLPSLMPKKNAIEIKVQELFNSYEIANSRFSNHELQLIEDAKPKNEDDHAVQLTLIETAQDREDLWNKERSEFQIGPYDDRLTKIQYIFIKQNFGSDPVPRWLLPQAEYDSKLDNSLLDTGRRALAQCLKINNGFTIVSKIPSSVYSYKYPKKIRERLNYDGAKVFFLKAHLDGASRSVLKAIDSDKNKDTDGCDKFKWLTRNEAFEQENKINLDYMRSLSQGLLHEDRVETVWKH